MPTLCEFLFRPCAARQNCTSYYSATLQLVSYEIKVEQCRNDLSRNVRQTTHRSHRPLLLLVVYVMLTVDNALNRGANKLQHSVYSQTVTYSACALRRLRDSDVRTAHAPCTVGRAAHCARSNLSSACNYNRFDILGNNTFIVMTRVCQVAAVFCWMTQCLATVLSEPRRYPYALLRF